MKAFELTGTTPDGKTASVWACGKCLRFTPLDPSKDAAERCCQPTLCACGAETATGYQCDACRKREQDARDKALFDKAKKVPASQHDGWLYDERSDRYFEDVESLLEHLVVTFEEEAREYAAKRSKEGAELAKAEVPRG